MFPSIIFVIIFMYVLFVALTPGVLLTLPHNSSHIIVALVHGLIFIIVGVLTTILIAKFSNRQGLGYNPSSSTIPSSSAIPSSSTRLHSRGLGYVYNPNHFGIPSRLQQIINNNLQKQEYDLRKKIAEEDKISNEVKIKQLNESITYYDDMKKKEMSNTTSVVNGSGLNTNIYEYDLKIQQAEEEIDMKKMIIQKDDRIINQPLQNLTY